MKKIRVVLTGIALSLALATSVGLSPTSVRADAGGAPWVVNVSFVHVAGSLYIYVVEMSNGDVYRTPVNML